MNHYLSKQYLGTSRLHAYIEQYKYINDDDKILEIGNGAGVFGDIASKIADYKVIDIDESTSPDFIADITRWEDVQMHKDKYDVIFCCQVLEHMPFDLAIQAVENLGKLNATKLIISIPDNRKALKFKLMLSKVNIEKVYSIPFTGIDRNISNNKEHHWEIWHKNIKEIKKLFNSMNNYTLTSEYRLLERTYQHFFILEKNEKDN